MARRRLPRRRPRNARRGRRALRMRRMMRRNPVHYFKRTVYLEQQIGADSIGPTSTHFGFTLSLLPDYTDFTNLFDQYCIRKVIFKMIPRFTQFNAGYSNVNNLLTHTHTAIDYDDSTALPTTTGLAEICQYESHRMTPATRVLTRVIYPKVELSGDGPSGFPKSNQWIDCDDTTALHNGLKIFIPQMPGTGNELRYDVQMTYHIKCKNVV